ncbi:MAG: hypothetical protein QM687_03460 [Ferruginibacter sp.]
MKNSSKLILAFFIIFLCRFTNASAAPRDLPANISYQEFYDELSPYGTWIDYPNYGHVWHPGIAGDFRPYLTNGYWNYTADGWFWQSDYNWGWAPFHYGRWIYDDTYGWLWIPGYEWSPAWVTWGSYDDYYAWAPLMPDVYVGLAFNQWKPAAFYWNVCGKEFINDHNIYSHVLDRNMIAPNINRISIINNFNTTKTHNQYYSRGPQLDDAQHFANKKIPTAALRDMNAPAAIQHKDNQLNVYRPVVNNPQPREFRRLENNNSTPVRNDNDQVSTPREQQQNNVQRMPVHNAPANMFGNGGGRGHR